MISKEKIRALRVQAQSLPAMLQIGKNGLTQPVKDEIMVLLKRHRLIKVKFLKSAPIKAKEVGEELAEEMKSTLIDARGNTLVLRWR